LSATSVLQSLAVPAHHRGMKKLSALRFKPDRKLAAAFNANRKEAAYHEAGHLVVARELGCSGQVAIW